jgi:DNA-binding transcriptional ArsR family regulator
MVNIQAAELDVLFYALSDSTRRRILALVGERAHTVGELAEPFKMSLAAVSKHIKILENAKLLVRKKLGRVHSCTLDPTRLKSAEDCIRFYTQFWNQRLDHLTDYLEGPSHAKRPKK